MKFDFKDEDVKSWATLKEVKKGEEGYFFKNFLDVELSGKIVKGKIFDTCGFAPDCFYLNRDESYPFFLPLNKVKEVKNDKPKEKEYRPFRTIAEVDELLAKDSVKHYCFVGSDLYLRYKAKPNITKQITITNLEVDTKTNRLLFINSFTPKYLVKTFDIKLAGEWFPFGVEVKE